MIYRRWWLCDFYSKWFLVGEKLRFSWIFFKNTFRSSIFILRQNSRQIIFIQFFLIYYYLSFINNISILNVVKFQQSIRTRRNKFRISSNSYLLLLLSTNSPFQYIFYFINYEYSNYFFNNHVKIQIIYQNYIIYYRLYRSKNLIKVQNEKL